MIMMLYAEMSEEVAFDDPVSAQVNLTRIICCVILHVLLIPEIDSALSMMKYSINHSDQFKYLLVENKGDVKSDIAVVPFLIATTKLAGAFLAECINMIVICSSKST